jgi:hypothetical protein
MVGNKLGDNKMLHMGKTTKQSADEIISDAVTFFGPGGVGLEVQTRGPNTIRFRGGGGFVLVGVEPKNKDGEENEIDIQTREWDYDVRRFLKQY